MGFISASWDQTSRHLIDIQIHHRSCLFSGFSCLWRCCGWCLLRWWCSLLCCSGCCMWLLWWCFHCWMLLLLSVLLQLLSVALMMWLHLWMAAIYACCVDDVVCIVDTVAKVVVCGFVDVVFVALLFFPLMFVHLVVLLFMAFRSCWCICWCHCCWLCCSCCLEFTVAAALASCYAELGAELVLWSVSVILRLTVIVIVYCIVCAFIRPFTVINSSTCVY